MSNVYEFKLRHRARDGDTKNAAINPLSMYLVLSKYGGSLRFELNADDATVSTFEDYDYIDVLWRNEGLGIVDKTSTTGRGFVLLARMIYRDDDSDTDQNDQTIFTARCFSKWYLLQMRQIMYQNDTTNRTKFTSLPVETIGKSIIQYNCTDDATIANGRFRNGDLSPGMGYTINIATDAGRGLVRGYASGNGGDPKQAGVLKNIVNLASNSGGEFRLTETGVGTYSFDFNEGQQGEDKFSEVIFSTSRRNIRVPHQKNRRAYAPTVALAAGQGEAPNRQISDERTAASYSANNDIEMFVDARDLDNVSDLNDRADEKLYQLRPQVHRDFIIIQTADTFFANVDIDGRNTYFIGDVVQIFGERQQIAEARIDWSSEVPSFEILTEDL